MKKRTDITRYMRPAAILLLGALLLSAPGCVKRDLEIRPDVPVNPPGPDNPDNPDQPGGSEGAVSITLDWGGDPRPQTARFLFYNESGALVKEIDGLTDGFEGTLPAGTYRLVVHNTDAGQVDWRGTDRYETAEVFAQRTNYSDGHHPAEGVPCVLEPQAVFGTGSCSAGETITVTSEPFSATVVPVELTRSVKMRFEVETSGTVRSLTGVLDGIAPGVFLSNGEHNTSHSCAMEFVAAPEAASAPAMRAGTRAASTVSYAAELNLFNMLTRSDSPAGTNNLSVMLTLEDGTRAMGTFDITEALKRIIADNGDDLPGQIPLSVTLYLQETSLNATVEPWDESGSASGDPRPQA